MHKGEEGDKYYYFSHYSLHAKLVLHVCLLVAFVCQKNTQRKKGLTITFSAG